MTNSASTHPGLLNHPAYRTDSRGRYKWTRTANTLQSGNSVHATVTYTPWWTGSATTSLVPNEETKPAFQLKKTWGDKQIEKRTFVSKILDIASSDKLNRPGQPQFIARRYGIDLQVETSQLQQEREYLIRRLKGLKDQVTSLEVQQQQVDQHIGQISNSPQLQQNQSRWFNRGKQSDSQVPTLRRQSQAISTTIGEITAKIDNAQHQLQTNSLLSTGLWSVIRHRAEKALRLEEKKAKWTPPTDQYGFNLLPPMR
jgi:hypothetical protein